MKEMFKQIVKELRDTNRIRETKVEAGLRKNNIGIHRAQHRILMSIVCGNCTYQKDLANHLKLSPATITVSMKKLEKDGYVEKNVLHGDNRYNKIIITESGKEVIDKSINIFDDIDATSFKDFTEEECAQFLSYLRRMNSNLED